jgi:histidinol-phosphate aminotransferase
VAGEDLGFHGDQEVWAGALDFAVNVRLPGPPPWLRARLVAELDRLGSYPDGRRAVGAVAGRHGRAGSEVLLTAGAAESFVLLARALRPRHAVCVHPSFTEPEAALRRSGHPVARLILPPPYLFDPASVPADADLVVLGNPTNPTGVLHPADAVRTLCRPGRVVVVDEAFIDAVPGEAESLAADRREGLVVVRSLTKTWGLAGLRAGYLLGPPAILERLAAAQPHWPVSALSLAALEACSGAAARAEAESAAAEVVNQRDYLIRRLGDVGVRPQARSRAPFVLVRVPDGPAVRARLRAAGIATRRGDTFPGLTRDHLRLTVRPAGDVDRLAKLLG